VQADYALYFADVGGTADKRNCDDVDAVLESELKVFMIFIGEGWNAGDGAGKIDALVLGEETTVDDLADDIPPLHGKDFQRKLAVGQKDSRAGSNFLGKSLKAGRYQSRGAEFFAGGDDYLRAGFEHNRHALFEAPGAHLRALKVLKDADGSVLGLGDLPKALDDASMFLVGTVREVETSDIHAATHEVADH
jgi:hypothetical protein